MAGRPKVTTRLRLPPALLSTETPLIYPRRVSSAGSLVTVCAPVIWLGSLPYAFCEERFGGQSGHRASCRRGLVPRRPVAPSLSRFTSKIAELTRYTRLHLSSLPAPLLDTFFFYAALVGVQFPPPYPRLDAATVLRSLSNNRLIVVRTRLWMGQQ